MSEIVKNLWGKLYAWALPSALALGVYWLFVYPKTTIGLGWLADVSETEKAAIFIAMSATIGFCLNAFSEQLYRILEGYLLWPPWLQKLGERRQLRRKRELEKAASGIGWRRGLEIEKLALYPLRDEQVVPTRFGNAIRSFEQYGKTRFNLDSQTLWYELCAVAPKYIQTEVYSARSSVDFFVALIYLSAALGVATFIAAAFEGFDPSILAVCIAALVVTVLSYWLVERATRDWGFAVQALVNIGRSKLADSLGLQLPASLDEEKKMWGLVTSYVYFGNATVGTQIDRFRKSGEAKGSTPTPAEIDILVAGGELAEDGGEPEEDDGELQGEA